MSAPLPPRSARAASGLDRRIEDSVAIVVADAQSPGPR
jgi:hypothetical protein